MLAGSEVIYGFQNAQLLPQCIAIAASSRHQLDTLKATRVIYPVPARRITRGASPEQANILAGSEVIYGFQNAQLLPRCIAIAASSWHQSDTLKATTSDLSSAGTPNH